MTKDDRVELAAIREQLREAQESITEILKRTVPDSCGPYHEENKYGVCRICAQNKAAKVRKKKEEFALKRAQFIRSETEETT